MGADDKSRENGTSQGSEQSKVKMGNRSVWQVVVAYFGIWTRRKGVAANFSEDLRYCGAIEVVLGIIIASDVTSEEKLGIIESIVAFIGIIPDNGNQVNEDIFVRCIEALVSLGEPKEISLTLLARRENLGKEPKRKILRLLNIN